MKGACTRSCGAARGIGTLASLPAVDRIWRIQDCQGQIRALAFKLKSVTPFELFHLRSEAVFVNHTLVHGMVHVMVHEIGSRDVAI